MFAVIKTGGKQYRVSSGDTLRIERVQAEAGDKIQFNDILMMGDTIGAPLVAGAAVQAEVIDQIKGDKVINFVRRRRKHSSMRTKGHRQQLTLVRILDLLEKDADKSGVKAAVGGNLKGAAAPAAKPAKAAPKKAAAAPKDEPRVEGAAGADDLKQLSGVGPALEKKLHAAGVTSFAQIAAWGQDDIDAMNEQLSFKGRIEREGWVDQAKALSK